MSVVDEGVVQDDDLNLESEVKDEEFEEITIGQSESPAEVEEETPLIKQMRQQLREANKKARELERKVVETPTTVEHVPDVLPPKKLSDFDYDEDEFNAYYEKRNESLLKHKRALELKEAENEKQKQAVQGLVKRYEDQKSSLRVDKTKFQEAEDLVVSMLDLEKQNLLLKTDMTAQLVYALGNNLTQLKRLAEITDRDVFIREVAKLEPQLVTTNKKRSAPEPEKRITGGGAAFSQTKLDSLREEAAKTGDTQKLMEYKRSMKN